MSSGSADGHFPSVCRAAIVTQVNDERGFNVSLTVFNPEGWFINLSVDHDGGVEPKPVRTWHWPDRECGTRIHPFKKAVVDA
jgi:hypothetical protein